MKIQNLAIVASLALAGAAQAQNAPVFSLGWSEYPSWSAFGVAEEMGLINGEEGQMGSLERKWNVDITLAQVDYDTCMTLYGSGDLDFVCLVAGDALIPAQSIPSTIVLPTSNSYGADALVVDKSITSFDDLRNHTVYGFDASVQQYTFTQGLAAQGEDADDYDWANSPPETTAQKLSSGEIQAGMLWNPYLLQTLNTNPNLRVMFDSTLIENQIIDSVVATNSALEREGGDRAAACIANAFYAVTERMTDSDIDVQDDTYIALGERFSNLGVGDMRTVCRQTRFFSNPDESILFMAGRDIPSTPAVENLSVIMQTVTKWAEEYDVVENVPNIGINGNPINGSAGLDLDFDPQYITLYLSKN
tara:strand:+ start:18141 stop:19226 length:1086 start_codon:yes stop_codon:yes gene_type:complete